MTKYKHSLFRLLFVLISTVGFSQANQKQVTTDEKLFAGYFNQTRLSSRFGLWSNVHYRTTDHFVNRSFQALGRLGVTFFATDHFRITAGYCFAYSFPEKGLTHGKIEHRPWQQLLFKQDYRGVQTIQQLRLEERYNQIVINDEATHRYLYTNRLRYSYMILIPFSKNGVSPGKPFLVLNDEVFVNFGKNITYNVFDQNRFFAGVGYSFNKANSVHVGYMNIYQQKPSGNSFINSHCIRVFYYHNLDFRKESR